jgi:mediator of RNA polymerase II transcription subunit 14
VFFLNQDLISKIKILTSDSSSNKRKSSGAETPAAKQQKTIYPAYFIPELAHIVAMCDEKLPFVMLAQELTKRKIPHSGLQVEANATSLVLKLLSLPKPLPMQPQQTPVAQQSVPPQGPPGVQQQPQQQQPPSPEQGKSISPPKIENKIWNALLKRLLSVSIRAQFNKINQTRIWTVEFVFCSTPLPSSHGKEQGK